MKKQRGVYVLLTESKVHAFTSYAGAAEVFVRARRMGVAVEFVQATLRARKARDPNVSAAGWMRSDGPCACVEGVFQ